ncbi:MAG: hypothetical protein HRT87_10205 [Legionellales bacterium]|nr:hypothetical protein [Legionellales bacterium]
MGAFNKYVIRTNKKHLKGMVEFDTDYFYYTQPDNTHEGFQAKVKGADNLKVKYQCRVICDAIRELEKLLI